MLQAKGLEDNDAWGSGHSCAGRLDAFHWHPFPYTQQHKNAQGGHPMSINDAQSECSHVQTPCAPCILMHKLHDAQHTLQMARPLSPLPQVPHLTTCTHPTTCYKVTTPTSNTVTERPPLWRAARMLSQHPIRQQRRSCLVPQVHAQLGC